MTAPAWQSTCKWCNMLIEIDQDMDWVHPHNEHVKGKDVRACDDRKHVAEPNE